jgi:hypothetical protein
MGRNSVTQPPHFFTTQVCGHRNHQPFISVSAAQRIVDSEATELHRVLMLEKEAQAVSSKQKAETMHTDAAKHQSPGDTLMLERSHSTEIAGLARLVPPGPNCHNAPSLASQTPIGEDASRCTIPVLDSTIFEDPAKKDVGAIITIIQTHDKEEDAEDSDRTVQPSLTDVPGKMIHCDLHALAL